MKSRADIRSARELSVGQRFKLVNRYKNWEFIVISADHQPGNPFTASNIQAKRLVQKKLFGLLSLGWKKTEDTLALQPDEEIILI